MAGGEPLSGPAPSHLHPPRLQASAALFLDFDGTLVALAPRPQDVQVAPWVVPTLARLQLGLSGALAVVSGRALDQLDHYLQPLVCWAAGAHGAQLRGPGGEAAGVPLLPPTAVLHSAQALVAVHTGLLLEHKPGGLALHYRLRPELAALCLSRLQAAMAACQALAGGWELMQGHCVLEVKQQAVSKGAAVRSLLAAPVFAGRTPVFVGDDTTDEHGIAAVQAVGGYGVRVGPGASQAQFRLDGIQAVEQWLVASAAALPDAGPRPTPGVQGHE